METGGKEIPVGYQEDSPDGPVDSARVQTGQGGGGLSLAGELFKDAQ